MSDKKNDRRQGLGKMACSSSITWSRSASVIGLIVTPRIMPCRRPVSNPPHEQTGRALARPAYSEKRYRITIAFFASWNPGVTRR